MVEERLKQTLEKNRAQYIKPLLDLISKDTRVLGHGIDGGLEKNGQLYLESLFSSLDAFEVSRDPMKESVIQSAISDYGEGNPGHNYNDRYNLYARFQGGDGPSLMFNGHVDTMPPGEVSLWDSDPHSPYTDEKTIYGLGSCDMKGGLMASIMAVKLLQDAEIKLPGEVSYTCVVDEEGGGNGSIQAALRGRKADGIVVCEPTDGHLILAHMGFVFFKVDIVGKANHSGSKWKGVSAIEKSMSLMHALQALEEKWLEKFSHPLLPPPSLNVGVIEGGSAASTVAGNCSFSVCIHYLPEQMSESSVERMFKKTIYKACEEDNWLKNHIPQISKYQAGKGFEMDAEHPFVQAFCDSYEQSTGRKTSIAGSPAGCDSRIWKNIASCPTIQFGPGELEKCHSVNESLPLKSYIDSILIYAYLILNWCSENTREKKDE